VALPCVHPHHRAVRDLAGHQGAGDPGFELVLEVLLQRRRDTICGIMTADDLEDLAKEGSREAFEAVLAKVPDVEPDPWDQWTSLDKEAARLEKPWPC
jgi:hypothetical protein